MIEGGHDVVIIEKDGETARRVDGQLDCIVLQGEGNSLDDLRRAEIRKADIFISVTDSDEVNMIACGLVASEFGVPVKIARVRNIDYASARLLEKPFLGIDYIANPEYEAAQAILRAVEGGAVSDIMSFEQGSFQLRSFVISPDSPLRDQSLEQIRARLRVPFLVALIDRDGAALIPTGGTVVRAEAIEARRPVRKDRSLPGAGRQPRRHPHRPRLRDLPAALGGVSGRAGHPRGRVRRGGPRGEPAR